MVTQNATRTDTSTPELEALRAEVAQLRADHEALHHHVHLLHDGIADLAHYVVRYVAGYDDQTPADVLGDHDCHGAADVLNTLTHGARLGLVGDDFIEGAGLERTGYAPGQVLKA